LVLPPRTDAHAALSMTDLFDEHQKRLNLAETLHSLVAKAEPGQPTQSDRPNRFTPGQPLRNKTSWQQSQLLIRNTAGRQETPPSRWDFSNTTINCCRQQCAIDVLHSTSLVAGHNAAPHGGDNEPKAISEGKAQRAWQF